MFIRTFVEMRKYWDTFSQFRKYKMYSPTKYIQVWSMQPQGIVSIEHAIDKQLMRVSILAFIGGL